MPTRMPSPGSRLRMKIRREGCERTSRSARAHLEFPNKDIACPRIFFNFMYK